MATGSPKERVTIIEIAAAAGVFKSTVSLALKGSENVQTAVRERVNAVTRDVGYVYIRGAVNLRRARSNLVGMIINDLTNPFFAELAVEIEHSFQSAGHVPLVANRPRSKADRNIAEDHIAVHQAVRGQLWRPDLRAHGATGMMQCETSTRRQLQCCLAAATVNSGLGTGPACNVGGSKGNPGPLTMHTGQRSARWLPRTRVSGPKGDWINRPYFLLKRGRT